MTIANYSQLKQAVAAWLVDSTLQRRIEDFIGLAENLVSLDLRVRAMETSADIAIERQEVALPERYAGVRRLYLDVGAADRLKLAYYPPQDFYARNFALQTGTPKAYTIEGEQLVFRPAPAGVFTGRLLYYRKFAPLVDDADTNWVLSNAAGLLLYGALLEAATFLEDDTRALTWAAKYEDLLERAHRADRNDQFPKGALSARSDVRGL